MLLAESVEVCCKLTRYACESLYNIHLTTEWLQQVMAQLQTQGGGGGGMKTQGDDDWFYDTLGYVFVLFRSVRVCIRKRFLFAAPQLCTILQLSAGNLKLS